MWQLGSLFLVVQGNNVTLINEAEQDAPECTCGKVFIDDSHIAYATTFGEPPSAVAVEWFADGNRQFYVVGEKL